MKNILTLIAIFLASSIYAQKYVLLEINSEWNLRNSAKIDKIKNVEYRIAYLEEQTPAFRKKIKSVPIAILYKDNTIPALNDAIVITATPAAFYHLGTVICKDI